MKIIKCVVVGDPSAEKTVLLHSFKSLMEGKEWPPPHMPTLFEYQAVKMNVGGANYSLTLWDTSGEEEFGRLRPLTYSGTDVFLICFAVTSPNSLQIAKDMWIPEIKKCSPSTPFILVGTQLDKLVTKKRNDRGEKPVKTEVAAKVAKKTGASFYLECSAKERQGVKAVFEAAVKAAVLAPVWETGGPTRFRQVTRTFGNFLTESYTAIRHVEFTIRGFVGLLRGMNIVKYMELHRRGQSRRSIASMSSQGSSVYCRDSPSYREDRKFSL
ncbi:cell division control protein 42 homolog [Glandiceps talaboti]